MTPALRTIIDTFASVDDEMRLELLLDYARRLPALPPHLAAQRGLGANRVHECMTPVFLWLELDEQRCVRIHADVAEEAPTVRGLLSLLVAGCDGAAPEEVAELPLDLLGRLQLRQQIRMNRAVGISAIVGRIRRSARELCEPSTDFAAGASR